jgi:MGT family glycosyltransferase
MRYLFCPLASHGFVYPLIGLAEAARSQGHEVNFVTHSAFSETLHGVGLPRIPCGTKDLPSFEVKHWTKPLTVAIQVKHIQYALERFSADVLVTTQLTLGPLIASEITGLPVVVLGLAAYLWPLWPLDYEPESRIEKEMQWRYEDMMAHYNKARRALGLSLDNADHLANPMLGDLYLLQSVPELEQSKYAFPSNVYFVGSCGWEPATADSELSAWLEEGKAAAEPIIYVQQGRSFTLPGFWAKLCEALRDKPIRVVADVGRMDEEVGSTPGNFFIREHVPLGKVLPYCAAVISTAHTTSVLGALVHGLPCMFFPSGSGSDDIARHCESAGAALRVYATDVDARLIESSIHELLTSSELRDNAQRLKRAFERAGGSSRAARLIEQTVASRCALT